MLVEVLKWEYVRPTISRRITQTNVRDFEKWKVYSSFIDNIWVSDLADMQLTSKFNIGFRLLLCVTDILSKYAWVIPLKHEKEIKITNAFQKNLDQSKCKPNKIWGQKGSWNHC